MVESHGSDDLEIQLKKQLDILETSIKTAIIEDAPSPRIESMLWRLFNEIKTMHKAVS